MTSGSVLVLVVGHTRMPMLISMRRARPERQCWENRPDSAKLHPHEWSSTISHCLCLSTTSYCRLSVPQGSTQKSVLFFESQTGGIIKPSKTILKTNVPFSIRAEIPTLPCIFLFGLPRNRVPFYLFCMRTWGYIGCGVRAAFC